MVCLNKNQTCYLTGKAAVEDLRDSSPRKINQNAHLLPSLCSLRCFRVTDSRSWDGNGILPSFFFFIPTCGV